MFRDKPQAKPEEQKDAPIEVVAGDQPQDKPQGLGDKAQDVKREIASEKTPKEKSVQKVEESETMEKMTPVADASSTPGEEPVKKSGRRKRNRAPGGGGEIRLELHGLKIESVDKAKGLIIISPEGTAATPPSKPENGSLPILAAGTEVKGRVKRLYKKPGEAGVLCDIGQARLAPLGASAELAERLRCGEELPLVVQGMSQANTSTMVALTPAVEEEVLRRTPSRKPWGAFEVGMEVEGYVQVCRRNGPGVFVDVHGPHDVFILWSEVRRSGIEYPRVGDHLRLKLVAIEAETGKMEATILT